jgi:mannose-6-phosphate isomerase-like protein (cupin superfamily)
MNKESRPWGEFHILYDNDVKIKRLIVLPQKRLSLQSHHFRKEFWLVIKGSGKAQLDDNIIDIQEGSIIIVEKNQKHRLINNGVQNTLEIIEIQTGSYFGEDDIIRYEDDFQRL